MLSSFTGDDDSVAKVAKVGFCGGMLRAHGHNFLTTVYFKARPGKERQFANFGCSHLVGSGTGAVAPQDRQSPVSNPRHITRSVRISRTTRSCMLHDKGYESARGTTAAQEG